MDDPSQIHGREFPDLSEVEAALLDESSGFREKHVSDVGAHTVAFLPVSTAGILQPGAAGSLVSFQGSYYILTASHVWEKVRPKPSGTIGKVAITLKEGVEHQCLLDPKYMTAFVPAEPGVLKEWGPDIVLVAIPTLDARRIEAIGRGVFYDLSIKRKPPIGDGAYIQSRILTGNPAELATYAGAHADLRLNGIILPPEEGVGSNREPFDYIDLDLSFHELKDFRGFSGGGLWRLLFYKDTVTGKIESTKILEGMAFYQLPSSSVVRCHGPRSIGCALRALFQVE